MLVNWQSYPERAADATSQVFVDGLVAEFGAIAQGVAGQLLALLHPGEKVQAMAYGSYLRLRSADGERVTIGGVRQVLVVSNERIIWLQGAYLFWSFKNISTLTPIKRGDLRFVLSDGSKVQIALELWAIRRERLAGVNAALASVMATYQ